MHIDDLITPHFGVDEMVRGSGVPDNPTVRANLLRLCKTLLEPLRYAWGQHIVEDNLGGSPAITVIDGYRSPAHNAAVDGASASRHMTGEAADICCDVDWHALREGNGSPRDSARMYAFVTWAERWLRNGTACGGLGIYTSVPSGQLYWIHVDVRPRVGGRVAVWAGHHRGSEQ